jgi:uncharacterized protein (TIGR02145 family)
MLPRNLIKIFILSIIGISIFSCKPEEVILLGTISGYVTEDEFGSPLQAVSMNISPLNNTTSTGSDGKYQFKNFPPGDYQIEASKPPYAKATKSATVTSTKITPLNFILHKIQNISFSEKYLDFGFDSTLKSFTITNTGTGALNYSIITSQSWISVSPNIGEITTEPDTIRVTINRNGLYDTVKYMENIEIDSHVGQDLNRDTVEVFANGVMDQDKNYYGVVTIGTQTWMAENLNTGVQIYLYQLQQDNNIKEKWCYDCETYGGLYTWYEAMQYNPSDTRTIGTTQGICPDGWHMPTPDELYQLLNYCGGNKNNDNYANRVFWAKLKEVGFTHWPEPNTGAIDTFGFTALPGGNTDGYNPEIGLSDPFQNKFYFVGEGFFMMTSEFIPAFDIGWSNSATCLIIRYCLGIECFNGLTSDNPWSAKSVRCIKDP